MISEFIPMLRILLKKLIARDIRAYQYEDDAEARVFNWIPNDRKAKVTRADHSTTVQKNEDALIYEEL
ncbi:hypothetical protein Y032_0298g1765 [Ancylostoma ceylanicum]|uniref:Uncharacterized protein n=1 Tax=Ancylostoma ceylanicum TaxID=53326 RepID=A0A016S467_9BILA|nr:hypothetical protein Y032_0298g1765 [Ancylostoma ceylanicum]